MARKGYQEIKREDGSRRSWRIRLADPRGGIHTRVLPGTTPEAEVQRIVAAIRTDLERQAAGLPPLMSSPTPSLAIDYETYAARWLQETAILRGWSKPTWRNTRDSLALAAAHLPRYLDEITPSHISSYHAYLLQSGHATSTTRNILGRLLACLLGAHEAGLMEQIEYKIPSAKRVAIRPPQVVSPEHYQRLSAEAPEPLHTILRLLWHTGARVGEISHLREEDIQEGKIVFGRHRGARKTGERLVPAPPDLIQAIRSVPYHERLPKGRCFGNLRRIQQKLADLCKRLDLPAYSPKDFRTTWATRAMRAGIDPATGAAYLGHSPAMLLEIYRQVQEEDLVRASEVIAALDEPTQGDPAKVIPLPKRAQSGHGPKER